MFLLFLIGLGTASVKAQVRIGGNTAPSTAAVLDLNASDAANLSTGGLVLPRVNLTSNTMQLTNGVANVIGTLVYDVTATLGRIGVYYWNGNSWVLASLPSTSAIVSGRFLMSTDTSAAWTPFYSGRFYVTDSILTEQFHKPVTWSLIVDTMVSVQLIANTVTSIYVAGLTYGDQCTSFSPTNAMPFITVRGPNSLWVAPIPTINVGPLQWRIRCCRMSF